MVTPLPGCVCIEVSARAVVLRLADRVYTAVTTQQVAQLATALTEVVAQVEARAHPCRWFSTSPSRGRPQGGLPGPLGEENIIVNSPSRAFLGNWLKGNSCADFLEIEHKIKSPIV